MDPKELFEKMWKEEEKHDPTHGGISKARAWAAFTSGLPQAENKNRSAFAVVAVAVGVLLLCGTILTCILMVSLGR